MPNWCTTNYAIRGSKDELKALVTILNTMKNHSNGFGRYWIGNLLMHFGNSYEDADNGLPVRCKGTFSPNPMEQACFAGPEINEEEQFSIDEDGILRISTVTAYYRFDDLEEFLKQQFPSLEFFWFTTDEFGNFHEIHDPNNLGEFCPFYLDSDGESSYYYQHEYEKFIADFREACPGLEIPDDKEYLSSDAFVDEFLKWRNADQEREDTYFYVATTK